MSTQPEHTAVVLDAADRINAIIARSDARKRAELEQIRDAMREAVTERGRVRLLTGFTDAQIDELGGVPDDDL